MIHLVTIHTVLFLHTLFTNQRHEPEIHKAHPPITSHSFLVFNHKLQTHNSLLIRSDTHFCRRGHSLLRSRYVRKFVRLPERGWNKICLKQSSISFCPGLLFSGVVPSLMSKRM